VGPRADPDRCGKSSPHWDSTIGQSSPQRVAIPTELSPPALEDSIDLIYGKSADSFSSFSGSQLTSTA
jgi:hypothetical protein